MNPSGIASVSCVLLSLALGACSSTKAKPAPAADKAVPVQDVSLRVEESALVTVAATVQAINLATREVTLKGAGGNVVTIIADKSVRRLGEVQVGDEVVADYYISLEGELRAPTAEEAANPITAVEVAGRAPMGTDPGAGAVRAVKIVTTVQAVDLAGMLVTLRGPLGDTVTIHAKHPENVKKLHVGDAIVVTYTQALAISLEKPSHTSKN